MSAREAIDMQQSFALIGHVHQQDESLFGYVDRTHNCMVLTYHPMQTVDGEPVIGAGFPLDQDAVRQFGSKLIECHDHGGWLDTNQLYLSAKQQVWYQPAVYRPMYFASNRGTIAVDCWWPNLIFKQTGRSLSLASYAGNGRPKPSTRLYHAPLWNVFSSTGLCVGGGDVSENLGNEGRSVWMSSVYDTVFSHSNHSELIRGVDHRKIVKEMRRRGREGLAFKAKDLYPLGMTLSEWVED